MHRWIAGSTFAAVVLSLAVASAQTTPRRVTVTGCLMHGTDATRAGWILSSAASSSRSGSPSHEASPGASPVIGTTGIKSGTTIDNEAHGGGTLGATDQSGSTVGAGAIAGATEGSTSSGSSGSGVSSGTSAVSYQLSGVRNPTRYANKRVEVTGTIGDNRGSASRLLRVTSMRVLGDTCH
jgi:hypothetical protein